MCEKFTYLNVHVYTCQDPAYKKVEPSKEINSLERDKFWAQEEEQEKKRQIEEVRKKQAELIKLEEETLQREVRLMRGMDYARKIKEYLL